ncbi:MAG: ABC transporter permease [Crenarchaeota archaeon]|nr:ABC transporter permease [Thermoproteota archaeon]
MVFKVLLWKELRSLLLNKGALISLVLIPIVILMAGQASVQQATKVATSKLCVAVTGPEAQAVERFLEMRGVCLTTPAKADLVIYASPGLLENLSRGLPVKLSVYYRLESLSIASLKAPLSIAKLLAKIAGNVSLVTPKVVVNATVLLPTGKAISGSVASMMMTMLNVLSFPLIFAAIFAFAPAISSMMMEYSDKTIEILLSQPVKRTTIALAKSVAATVTGLVQGGVMIAAMFAMMSEMPKGLGGLSLQALGSPSAMVLLAASVIAEMVFAASLALAISVFMPGPEAMGGAMAIIVVIGIGVATFATSYGVPLAPLKALMLSPIPLIGPMLVSALNLAGAVAYGWLVVLVRLVEAGILIKLFARLLESERSLTAAIRFMRGLS